MAPPLAPEALRAVCDPASLGFSTTAELPPPEGVIGQERAMSAMSFGVAMKAPGYNLFVVGPPATGKTSRMRTLFAEVAQKEPTPPDLCYVHNFDDACRPRALALPPGRGRELRDLLKRAVDGLETQLVRAFEGEEFARRNKAIIDDFAGHEGAFLEQLGEAARAEGFSVLDTDGGITMSISPDGKPLDEEAFAALPPKERDRLEAKAKALEARAEPLLRATRQLRREAEEARDKLVKEVAQAVARELFADVRARFEGIAEAIAFLDAIERDIAAHAGDFVAEEEDEDDEEEPEDDEMTAWDATEDRAAELRDRYRVNLFIDRAGERGAPVVIEPGPSWRNLFGRIEHRVHLGTLVTDFMLIKPGALHRANGGYVLLEAKDLVADPYAWDSLKKALKTSSIRMEEPLEELHAFSTASLMPEPVPLAVKVVLVGSPDIYHLLYEADEDFRELFKVKADFDDSLLRTPETERLYARFVAGACRDNDLPPLDAGAVARLVEHASRIAEHQRRLSARFGDLVDLLREAAFHAGRREAKVVCAEDVDRAIQDKAWRNNLLEEQLSRMTIEGELLVDTAGAAVGQLNGLEVFEVGEHAFGRPFRITARARPGKPGVVDVEREVGLGGAIHSKGVLIVGGYLAGRYATRVPLAMSATLVAEQSYEMVDGDSASCAELCALLSTLANVPLAQSLALTGAVNQAGQVQPVGGVNEKIEGFFDLCRARGLTGKEGVLIPQANVRHLMLRADVVEAVRAGLFQVRAVATVDEAIAILAGREAGVRAGDDGEWFPADGVNALVEKRLVEFARAVLSRAAAD